MKEQDTVEPTPDFIQPLKRERSEIEVEETNMKRRMQTEVVYNFNNQPTDIDREPIDSIKQVPTREIAR
jgi:hypothetical protein